MNKEKISKFLQQLRTEKKITQETLAEKLGVNSKSISKYETGSTLPDLETFVKYCEIFDVTLYEISKGEKLKENKYNVKDFLINRHTLRKMKYKKTLICAILLFFISITIYCYIFTITNYKSIERYEIKSINEHIKINGYYFTNVYYKEMIINGININNTITKAKEKVNYIKYEARYEGQTIFSHIMKNDNIITLREALSKYQPLLYSNNKKIKKFDDNDEISLIIYYGIDEPDKFVEIKLKFEKLYSNYKIY